MESDPVAGDASDDPNAGDPEYGTFAAAEAPPGESGVGAGPGGGGGGDGAAFGDPTSPGASVKAIQAAHGPIQRVRTHRASFAGLTTKSSKLLRAAPAAHRGEDAPPLLVWRRLNLSYGPSAPVIVNCSGAVDRGHFVAVLGPSGSGKTSLIDLLSSRKTTG